MPSRQSHKSHFAIDFARKSEFLSFGRKDRHYAHNHDEILAAYGQCLAEHGENPPIFRQAMGNERYIFRAPTDAEIFEIADFVLKKR